MFSVIAALAWLGGARGIRASDINLISPRIGVASGQGFCSGGAFQRTSWPRSAPPGIRTWGSYCSDGDRGTAAMFTSPFAASRSLRLYLAGYTSNSGTSLEIERLSDRSKFVIRPVHEPHEEWQLYDFSLPRSWSGSLVRLIASDQNTGPGGWIAFSEPMTVPEAAVHDVVTLAAEAIGHFILLLLPGLAICGWIVRKGARNPITVGLVLLA